MNETVKYIIKRTDTPCIMLSGVGIGCNINVNTLQAVNWTVEKAHAIRFEKEEAEATIEFITNVIDWELGDQLISVPAEEY